MTSLELLKEIEAWLSFNTEPSKEETAKLRKSINDHVNEQLRIHDVIETMKNQKYSAERANYPFLPDVDEIEYKNKLTDLICDKILNYDGKSKFGGEKMQKVAEIVLKSKSLIDNNTKLQPMSKCKCLTGIERDKDGKCLHCGKFILTDREEDGGGQCMKQLTKSVCPRCRYERFHSYLHGISRCKRCGEKWQTVL